MADNYYQCTPVTSLKASKKEAEELIGMLESNSEEEYHGFRGEYYEEDNEFYMYCEDGGDADELPEEFLKKLGQLISKTGRKFLEFGYAFYCSKMRPGEFGGGRFRIDTDGNIHYPAEAWDDEVKGEAK